jgi:hypothetical protein
MDFTWITNDVGDITAVTAGTGISGGGTSGAVTITNSMATAIDAKGDLIAGTGADTFARLATGTAGQVLAVNTATATGLEWITPNPGDITAVNVTAPITGGGASGAVTIGVSAASTAASGVVQLSDSTSTTSSVLASTPTATKSAYDLANAAIAKSTVTTAGDIIYRNATVPVRLGIGTAGQVLKVNSGATAPEWATASSGGWTLLTSGTLSGATTTTAAFSTSYTDLRVIVTNFLPATDNAEFLMRFNADSGANRHFGSSNSPQINQPFAQTSCNMATGNDNSVATGLIIIDLPGYSNTTTWKLANSRNITVNATTTANFNIENRIGAYNQTTAISSLSFIPSTGNFTSGNYLVYGA